MAKDGLWYIISNYGLQGLIVVAIFAFFVDYILKKLIKSENIRKWIFIVIGLVSGLAIVYFNNS